MHNPIYIISYSDGVVDEGLPILHTVGYCFNQEQAQKISDHLESYYDLILQEINKNKVYGNLNELYNLVYKHNIMVEQLPLFGSRIRFHVRGPISYMNVNEIRGSFDRDEVKDFFWNKNTLYGENKND